MSHIMDIFPTVKKCKKRAGGMVEKILFCSKWKTIYSPFPLFFADSAHIHTNALSRPDVHLNESWAVTNPWPEGEENKANKWPFFPLFFSENLVDVA